MCFIRKGFRYFGSRSSTFLRCNSVYGPFDNTMAHRIFSIDPSRLPCCFPLRRSHVQSKAFLLSNPRLSAKLQVAVAGKLASGGTPAAASNTTSEEIISDPPSIAASSETVEANESTTVDSVLGGAPEGEPSVSTRDVGLSPHEGVPVDAEEGEDILLEPGVASVEELLKSDVFSKEGGRGMEQRQGDPTATVQG